MNPLDRLPMIGLAVVLLGCQGTEPANTPSFPPDAEPSAALGSLAVATRQCGQCHQSPDPRDGILSGRAPQGGTPEHGANLTPDPDTGMDAWDADSIASAVLQGIDEQGNSLCPPMPAFADAGMSQDEALAIALFLQGLTPVRHFVAPSMCAPVNPQKD